jgi:hypothetical protein
MHRCPQCGYLLEAWWTTDPLGWYTLDAGHPHAAARRKLREMMALWELDTLPGQGYRIAPGTPDLENITPNTDPDDIKGIQ